MAGDTTVSGEHSAGSVPDQSVLGRLVLAELKRKPRQKAAELARVLNADRREVNRCLHGTLAGKVQQDQTYRWSLAGAAAGQAQHAARPEAPTSVIGRLTRYYLECIGEDNDQGVSEFARNRYGAPNYAELPSLPAPDTDFEWWNAPGVSRVLGKVRESRGKLTTYVGYPVRLSSRRSARGEFWFVEPVLLWRVVPPEHAGDTWTIPDDLPNFNFRFLKSVAMGNAVEATQEAARLAEDLGFSNIDEDQPEIDELLDRLQRVRADWDWREPLDPEQCPHVPSLAELSEPGIYNRAAVIPGERSPFTIGLEAELKNLSTVDEGALAPTALGAWLSGKLSPPEKVTADALLEVLPMNLEQRDAVRAGLSQPLTVVTGPPGTGKSQVVTDLLVNAAWQGKRVLFASKNNKAVDVVEARVNGLGKRPVLLRLGAREYQARLSAYMTAMLSGTVTEHDEVTYKEALDRHRELARQLDALDQTQLRTLEARNTVDQLDSAAEDARVLLGMEVVRNLDAALLGTASLKIANYKAAADRADAANRGIVGRIAWRLSRNTRLEALRLAQLGAMSVARNLGVRLPALLPEPDCASCRATAVELNRRVAAARTITKYKAALDTLLSAPSFEDIARRRQQLAEQIAQNSDNLWKAYVHLTPKRLTPEQRKAISDYAAILPAVTGPDATNVNPAVRSQARKLQSKVTQIFACWAVTSLSAKGRIPFEPGYFDLLIIDEASQCDIASALPLLYRARRAVIIGDPQQLKHISALSPRKDTDLQTKYDLLGSRTSWMYSTQSLYDLAAGIAQTGNILNLRDHHRSHADIINFANTTFYGGQLRIATRYNLLRRPDRGAPGVIWHDVRGHTQRPPGGSADNPHEARALVQDLRDLVVTRGFQGAVGVVTPFRAQVQLISRLVSEDAELSALAPRLELLVETVHRFQGDERDVMFFSPVISDGVTPGALSFLRSNGNLFNVAITRARGLLQVVGDSAAALNSGIDYLAAFARYAAELATRPAQATTPQTDADLGRTYPSIAHPERVSDWERVFYQALYAAGIRPVPQYSVDQYDLDFAVFAGDRKLDLEVDGERYHRSWTGELCLRDQLRNQRLIELGWEVKRFWVYEIRDRMDDCVMWVKRWQAGS